MATSGTTTFNLDTGQIVEEALERLGGGPISGEEAYSARTSLNLLLAHLVNLSAPLSTQETKTFNTVIGTASYALPTDVINVLNVVYRNQSGKDTELTRDDMIAYNNMWDKDLVGVPTTFYIDRTKDNLVMYLWPKPDKVYAINYRGTTKIEDVNKAINNLDIPTTYLPAIISGLAYYHSMKRRNIDPAYRQELKEMYNTELKAALEEDRTRTSYYVRPKIST
jgi:hypothetical protein